MSKISPDPTMVWSVKVVEASSNNPRRKCSGGDTRARRMKLCRSEFLATFKNGTKTFLRQSE
ncbi:hypothetical protein HanXRQr2_Chr16g0734631 [Helianthus annuus]|uniref:Uncharacterized protein n=1 Tax=Helianthus annuus TaxID=4232 RepID=A0A251RY22_HELAN|nr:hypothetical protein HanXRQr2_Chr16g0734631 [Helianthus annuus]KAJ0437174.1 hypothetical protein HanHA300_Chr16g0599031 [Helianthus annuus]KAJ0459482.1 hypothetical protein HanHA89_Chr16g0649461 [Helianthus annuus]